MKLSVLINRKQIGFQFFYKKKKNDSFQVFLFLILKKNVLFQKYELLDKLFI